MPALGAALLAARWRLGGGTGPLFSLVSRTIFLLGATSSGADCVKFCVAFHNFSMLSPTRISASEPGVRAAYQSDLSLVVLGRRRNAPAPSDLCLAGLGEAVAAVSRTQASL